jgi:hypothetical protein
MAKAVPMEYFIPGYPIHLPLHVRTAPPHTFWPGHVVGKAAGKYSTYATRKAPIGSFDSSRWETYPQTWQDLCEPSLGAYLGVDNSGTVSGVNE